MLKVPEVQQTLFQLIKSKLPAHLSMPDEIADILDISNDSAYRRIRGEKPINIAELQLLCSHFNISLDKLLSIKSNNFVFTGQVLEPETFNFKNYLQNMLDGISKIHSFSNSQIIYSAKDIPVFHHFQFAEFSAFKYYFWIKAIVQAPDFHDKKYNAQKIDHQLFSIGKKIHETYNLIPSVEIWNDDTINSTIRQIEYCRESDSFENPDDIPLLYDQLELMINHIEKEAAAGEKFTYGKEPSGNRDNYQLYNNEFLLGDNSIIVTTGEVQNSYISHNVLNYFISSDSKFCSYSMQSMNNLMRKSALISQVNEKERIKFFNGIRKKIRKRRKKIKG